MHNHQQHHLVPDPFSNVVQLRRRDWLQLLLGTLLLVPFRAVCVLFFLSLASVVAKIGLIGLPRDQVFCTDVSYSDKWRLLLVKWYKIFGKLIFWSAGFWITVKGEQASREEAPILVGAPHSSFLEALIIFMCGCSPVSRHENKNAFLISACQIFYKTIFVDRRTADGRKQSLVEICDRARSPNLDLPQLFICPEGTNTNRKALIQFKVGAFAPGVPVQPVVIRYPGTEHIDAVTWTYHQNYSYLFSVWYLLAKPFNQVVVEFLPVYRPNQQEIQNAELFAKNVQKVMSQALNIQATDITYTKYYEEFCKKNGSYINDRPAKSKWQ